MVTAPGRLVAIALVVMLPLGATAIACTGGDDLAYSGGDGADGGDASSDGRPMVDDSGFLPTKNRDAGPALVRNVDPIACGDPALEPEGGCAPSAGYGCCITGAGGNDNQCAEQVTFSLDPLASFCRGGGDVFVACLGTDGDNLCCWQPVAGNGGFSLRYRAACDQGGFEACDPKAGGGVCLTGGPCKPTTCKGVELGYCVETKPCQ